MGRLPLVTIVAILGVCLANAGAAPAGLVPAPGTLIEGRTLRPAGLAVQVEAPSDWTWYTPSQGAGAVPLYVCAPPDDRLRIVLSFGGQSSAGQFVELMAAVESSLKSGWVQRGGTLSSFTYKEPADFPLALRYAAQSAFPGRREYAVGYAFIGAPTVVVQSLTASEHEPAELLLVARSIRRLGGAGEAEDRWRVRPIKALLYVGEGLIVLLLAWYLARQRRPTSLFGDKDA